MICTTDFALEIMSLNKMVKLCNIDCIYQTNLIYIYTYNIKQIFFMIYCKVYGFWLIHLPVVLSRRIIYSFRNVLMIIYIERGLTSLKLWYLTVSMKRVPCWYTAVITDHLGIQSSDGGILPTKRTLLLSQTVPFHD